ncbi:DUF2695 domain-containing protein [Candidatus Bathyarchaeota archaeon]|nr:DUF2695 domain-containing protein [Candidatus Bathyarchaeota archaeon]
MFEAWRLVRPRVPLKVSRARDEREEGEEGKMKLGDWVKFFNRMDVLMSIEGKKCKCNVDDPYSLTVQVVKELRFDIDHVIKRLKETGGYCDCETMFNSFEEILNTQNDNN